MREDRRRLHVFEAIPGTGNMEENPLVDHAKAVKEYDRSAADKEEPLPHELRPVQTLQLTMDYLVTNIMDAGDGRWADWFDFLWNRTRAIRKDITQQHLCEPGAVDLIEKTARFHIFCSHYLCDQDFGVFDPKINTENLTKCLQTLKHFYDDLYKKQNIICPDEAEFRAYDILLNLNEGDILRQVMTYREEVRSSPIVQFSMEVFNALNSNNYVRFFRLVRSSQYLCACLLHRYFTQARQQAIRILNHSHSVPNKEMPYPLSELTQMLEFEDENEAANFCRCHGLTVSEPNVVFIRGSFVEPENAFPPSKSLRLIESKRKSLIGEMVYNGPLPTKPSHNPVSSFSPNGQYISDSHVLPRSPVNIALATSPLTKGAFPKTHISVEEGYGAADSTVHRFSPPQSSTEPAKPTVNIDIEEQKEVTKTLFLEVINEMLVEITNDVFSTVQLLLRLSNDICREIEECSTSSLLQEIAQSSILDEQRHQIMKAEQAASREKASSALTSDIVDEVIDEECHQTANVVYNIEQEKIVQKCKDMAIQQISKNILEQSVHEEIQKLVEESCVELKAQRKLALQRIANRLIAVRTDRYFKRWVKKYRSLQRLKKLLGNFPAHCSLASPEQQLGRLIGPQYDAGTCTFHSTRIFGEEQNVAETISSKQAQLEQIRSRLLHPIDIPELIFNLSNPAFNRSTTVNSSCMDWKLLISFAKPCQDPDYFILNDNNANLKPSVIKAKFTKGTVTKNIASSLSRKFELVSLYRAEMPLGLSVRKSCRICTLASYGVPTNNEMTEITTSRQMVGTSAVLIVVESIELQTVSLQQELSTRVQRLLGSIPPIPGIPVLILFLENQEQQDNFTEEEIIEAVGIPNHLNHVSSVQVTRLPMLTKIERLNDVLKTAVSWLLHSYTELKLECSSLKDFVEEGVQQLFCTRFYDDFATRRRAGLGSQCPEASIALYNAVIDHLALVAASSKLGHVSWPAKEFYQAESSDIYWNTEPSLSSLRSVILSLMLPPPPPRAENGLWESEAQLCRQYIQQLSHNSTYLTQRVDSLLKRKRHSLHKSQVVAENIPWTQVIEACVSSVLLSLYTDSVLSQCKVHYFGNELETLQQPEIWRKAVLSSKEESTSESSRIQGNPFKKSKEALIHESVRSINEDLELILNNSNKHVVQKKKQSTSLENSIVDLKARLGLALSEARDDIVSFEKDLKRWLPEYYPGSSKKRKAEPAMQFQSPIVKSSRQSILDLPPQDTNIDMSHKAQGIRHN